MGARRGEGTVGRDDGGRVGLPGRLLALSDLYFWVSYDGAFIRGIWQHFRGSSTYGVWEDRTGHGRKIPLHSCPDIVARAQSSASHSARRFTLQQTNTFRKYRDMRRKRVSDVMISTSTTAFVVILTRRYVHTS